jgi:hypothetical protein
MVNREGAKDAKENDFFRIGTDDSEKIPALRAISAYCRAIHPQVSAVPPSETCRVVARRAKPEAAGSSFSLGQLTAGSKDLPTIRIIS